jgi:lipopolysaccharide export system protein LptC
MKNTKTLKLAVAALVAAAFLTACSSDPTASLNPSTAAVYAGDFYVTAPMSPAGDEYTNTSCEGLAQDLSTVTDWFTAPDDIAYVSAKITERIAADC